jgi:DNA-binding beta-propeller fold protein YncE
MALLSSTILLISQSARGVQPTGAIASPDIPVSHHDRVYTADQFSNTISVTDPVYNKLLGVIRLGYPLTGNLSPLYHGQLLVHGTGFSPDHHTIESELCILPIGN